MKALTFVLLLVAVVGVGAQRPMDMQHKGHMAGMMPQCPMNIKGADVAVADTPAGISLTFTASQNQVREIRRRVQEMAKMHNQMSDGASGMTDCCMGTGSATYEAVRNGARLTLKPKDPAQLESFRQQVRQHVQDMKQGVECCAGSDSGHCPMHPSSKAEK